MLGEVWGPEIWDCGGGSALECGGRCGSVIGVWGK